jgi:hypothetical protein
MPLQLAPGLHRVGFEPAVHGFAFPNAFVDTLVTLPGGTRITTAGRCGGMAALALDHFHAGVPVPRWGPSLWAPDRVPPDGHWLSDAIRERQVDSFLVGSALKFLTWSLQGDRATWALPGIVRRTEEDELPRLARLLDAGMPVVLGLVVARDLRSVAQNHQVVAYGLDYDIVAGRTTVLIHDPNSPGREVTLVGHDDRAGWVASNGHVWRGFFVHDYVRHAPPVFTHDPADPDRPLRLGDSVVLVHAWTGRVLHGGDDRYDHPGGSGQHRVTADDSVDGTRWRLQPRHDRRGHDDVGPLPVLSGDLLRLRLHGTDRHLHSHRGIPSPVSHQQEVSTFADRDRNDDWRVVVDGGGPWLAGSRVRLEHAQTGAALQTHLAQGDPDTAQEVTASSLPGNDGWWTVLEVG